jgi:hypothetical protein
MPALASVAMHWPALAHVLGRYACSFLALGNPLQQARSPSRKLGPTLKMCRVDFTRKIEDPPSRF